MSLDNPDRRGEKIKLLAQAIFQVSQKTEVQTRFAAGGKCHECWWSYAGLRYVVHAQTRATMRFRRHSSAGLPNRAFKESIQLRGRYAPRSGGIRLPRNCQKLVHPLAGQR